MKKEISEYGRFKNIKCHIVAHLLYHCEEVSSNWPLYGTKIKRRKDSIYQ